MVLGFVSIVASICVLVLPGVALVTLLFLLSFSMLFVGLSKLARGVSLAALSRRNRTIDMVTGLLGVAIGIIVFLFPILGIGTLIFLLAFGTMFYGIASVVIGGSAHRLTKGLRVLAMISGVIAIILSLIVMTNPAVALLSLVFLLSVSFVMGGVESIVLAFE